MILTGDCVEGLRKLPDGYAHTCVTSPPYYGLRDYGSTGQIGREDTPQAYIDRLVTVFAEVWRVLRDDGTLWLNLGDSYASSGGHGAQGATGLLANRSFTATGTCDKGRGGLPPKSLMGIPWRVAFALQDAGWLLRQDIIWSKPNPLPESVKDRCAKSHEYLFLFVKQRKYFFDNEAIKEPAAHTSEKGNGPMKAAGCHDGQRNKRSVWTVTTRPFPGLHTATFPPDLIEPCVLAGTSSGGVCSVCRTPYRRVIELGKPNIAHRRACGATVEGNYKGNNTKDYERTGAQSASSTRARILDGMRKRITTGWRQQCSCKRSKPVPALVIDPFGGAGTTGLVADRLMRQYFLCEINPEYAAMAEKRIRDDRKRRRAELAAQSTQLDIFAPEEMPHAQFAPALKLPSTPNTP